MSGYASTPQTCKACGHRHWLRDPHIWPDTPRSAKQTAAMKKGALGTPRRDSTGAVEATVLVDNRVANRHGKYADADKRKAYMRELMRTRRAANRKAA